MKPCESCGKLHPTKLRPYYAQASCEPSGTASVCDECYFWTPSDRVAANILSRLGLELTDYLKEELDDNQTR